MNPLPRRILLVCLDYVLYRVEVIDLDPALLSLLADSARLATFRKTVRDAEWETVPESRSA